MLTHTATPLHVPFPPPGMPSTGWSTRQSIFQFSAQILSFPEVSFDFSSHVETLCPHYALKASKNKHFGVSLLSFGGHKLMGYM